MLSLIDPDYLAPQRDQFYGGAAGGVETSGRRHRCGKLVNESIQRCQAH